MGNGIQCKHHLLEMGKSRMRPTWTYKLGNYIIPRASEDKDLGIFIHNNLSPEMHIKKTFGDTFRMLRNIGVAFHFLEKEMKKIITTMIRPKLEYAAIVWSPPQEKRC